MVNRGLLLIISGPSGVGKGTVCSAVLAKSPETVYSVSATTRSPREGEVHGKNYFFLSKEEFLRRREQGDFLEWAEVFGNYYGTPASEVYAMLEAGKNVILEIDTQGALQVMKVCPWGISIFILPPSFDELKKRIKGRGTESEKAQNNRLSFAQQEIDLAENYDYTITNDDVESAAEKIISIIAAERERSRG